MSALTQPKPCIYFDSGWRWLPNRAARRSLDRLRYDLQAYRATAELAAAVSALLVGVPE